ncbi:MAG: hypothetical protein NT003_01345 [Candidatus Magasanikbacteria bacterium]|nr:hypothetical protein [Candidatus Magasanikbacteria bacterium]
MFHERHDVAQDAPVRVSFGSVSDVRPVRTDLSAYKCFRRNLRELTFGVAAAADNVVEVVSRVTQLSDQVSPITEVLRFESLVEWLMW